MNLEYIYFIGLRRSWQFECSWGGVSWYRALLTHKQTSDLDQSAEWPMPPWDARHKSVRAALSLIKL